MWEFYEEEKTRHRKGTNYITSQEANKSTTAHGRQHGMKHGGKGNNHDKMTKEGDAG